MPSYANPFIGVYTELWNMLEGNSAFTAVVTKAGNKIKYTGGAEFPDKETMSDADFPEVRIVLAGLQLHAECDTSSSSCWTKWAIQVKSGRFPMSTILAVDWAVFRALHHWRTYLRTNVLWAGEEIVKFLKPREASQQLDGEGGITGWTTVWIGRGGR